MAFEKIFLIGNIFEDFQIILFMKEKKLKFLEIILRLMAVVVLKKHKPTIVGVTGSVGKSSTKEAIALVLGAKFDVRKNEENYNNEIGIPLTIIGAKSGKRSLWGWIRVLTQWVKVVFFGVKYPEIVVLELGIDRPGDMKYLLSFLPISVGVLTNVSSSHLEFFNTVGQIAREKGLLIKQLSESGTAIVCADDERVMRVTSKTKAKVITFGLSEEASIHADNISFSGDLGHFDGCHFKLSFDGKTIPVHLPFVVAQHHIQAVLAGIAVGMAFKLNPIDMVASVRSFRSLPGRMRVIDGFKQSWIIDDTYNSSPVSLHAALATLQSFQSGRRIVVLGDMLELGSESEDAHRKVAQWVIEAGADVVVLVGSRMLVVYESLIHDDYPQEHCLWFDNPTDAGNAIRDLITSGDIILVKGSQGMRMEKITEALMAHQEKAEELLCRQSSDWKRKLFVLK
jgi:UDP-N-acetylmuramoyl-tripeptide--D-alanyl-D-alanine ligase